MIRATNMKNISNAVIAGITVSFYIIAMNVKLRQGLLKADLMPAAHKQCARNANSLSSDQGMFTILTCILHVYSLADMNQQFQTKILEPGSVMIVWEMDSSFNKMLTR